jgi:hypothetical protein
MPKHLFNKARQNYPLEEGPKNSSGFFEAVHNNNIHLLKGLFNGDFIIFS